MKEFQNKCRHKDNLSLSPSSVYLWNTRTHDEDYVTHLTMTPNFIAIKSVSMLPQEPSRLLEAGTGVRKWLGVSYALCG